MNSHQDLMQKNEQISDVNFRYNITFWSMEC